MQSLYEILNPSSVVGAILCSVIGGVVLGGVTWFLFKGNKKKKSKVESNIHIGNSVHGDVNVGSTVRKTIKIEKFISSNDSRFVEMNSQVSAKLEALTKEISRFSSTEDKNFNALNSLLAERVKRRIDCLLRLDLTNWIYEDNAIEQRDKLLSDLKLLDHGSETRIREIVSEIGKEASAVEILFNEYIKLEKEQVNFLVSNILKDAVRIYSEMGMDYQNFIRSTIEKVIEKYNQNIEFITNHYSINQSKLVPNIYKKISERIYYNDIQDRNQKIQEVIENVKFSGDCGSINIIQNSKEEIPRHLIPTGFQTQVLHGDIMGGETLISFLEAVYESIDKNSLVQFSPHHHKNHVLFFVKLNNNEMGRLSDLQNRSNIAYYFFEKR
jgi:predicted DNA binding CopG/RHH family protein